MMKYLIYTTLICSLIVGCTDPDDSFETGRMTTTLRVVSTPGITPFPNGTTYDVYARVGAGSGGGAQFVDSVQLLPTQNDSFVLEGSFVYEGQFPVTIEVLETEEADVDPPYGFSDPFGTQNQRFYFDAPSTRRLDFTYFPNYWVDFSVYTVKSASELNSYRFTIGDGRSSSVIAWLNLNDREFIGDTLQTNGEGLLTFGTTTGIYLQNARVDGSDSLMAPITYFDLKAHDTTSIFFDADSMEMIVTH